ncbi:Iron-sulfur cluster assembly 2, mitochondrial [Perkinsus olseni]|uniref:Iron-sulfur cluster assembly 2, mitochondrial n=1 Tax=Perkinsus olseni TaxID=32597 RepID=A0A7J6PQ73_PEROL|nr:Iron-sulfur cluster assembly 2, mitochondrial [Perkinsus olseni]
MLSSLSSTLGRSILRPLAVRATPRFLSAAAPSQRWFSEVAAAAAQAAVSGNGNLTLKPAGVQHIIDVSKKRNIPTALRLTVDSGGCGGFQYYFDLVPAGSATATDTKVEADDGSVVMLVDALVVQGRLELYDAMSVLRPCPFVNPFAPSRWSFLSLNPISITARWTLLRR